MLNPYRAAWYTRAKFQGFEHETYHFIYVFQSLLQTYPGGMPGLGALCNVTRILFYTYNRM